VVKASRMRYVGSVARLGETEILIAKTDGRNYLGETGIDGRKIVKVIFK
jgi:hypothetical protein